MHFIELDYEFSRNFDIFRCVQTNKYIYILHALVGSGKDIQQFCRPPVLRASTIVELTLENSLNQPTGVKIYILIIEKIVFYNELIELSVF